MTTSLPSPSLPESALGPAAAGGVAAPTLLDLFTATLTGPTADSAPPTGVLPVPTADFASLLAPANPAPTPALPTATAPASALLTNVSAAPAVASPGRAHRLETNASPEALLVSAPNHSGEVTASTGDAPLDRSTLEAALALLVTVLPPPAQPHVIAAPASGSAPEVLPATTTDEANVPAFVSPAHLRVTLTTPTGSQVVPTTSTDESAPTSADSGSENSVPAAPATPTDATTKPMPAPVSSNPRPVAEGASLHPVQAELEWASGVKLAAHLAPAKTAPLASPTPAPAAETTDADTVPADLPTPVVVPAAVPALRRVPSAERAEKNAVSQPSLARPVQSENSAAEKNFLTLAPSEVTAAAPKAGIDVAQTPPAMPAASHHQPNAAASALPVAPSAAMARAEAPAAPAPEQTAQRAVETVLQIVHAQVVSKLQPVPSVQLRFKVGHEDLAVRVQLRDGEVRTEFRTDNAELRAAVAQEWRAVTAKPEAALRFLDPVITAANPSAQPGGTAGQGGSAFQQQQQAQQQQQQFRTQMELFGSVRRAFPAAGAPAELAPVTPLVPAATSHRLSAVA